ncbi:C2 protein [Maldovirus mali]|uniref:Transcriptional activator protein n=1 Tax=Maldovirus mali TaxID=2843704 RepID=A0A0D5W451_9GEMI|nr:C2 protein [Apple geminivirus 1]AJZ68899.1 C2 protein [Apple geminivirus 1]
MPSLSFSPLHSSTPPQAPLNPLKRNCSCPEGEECVDDWKYDMPEEPSRSQKIIHSKAKAAKRRRRVNCACGCIIYINPDCQEYGFSHRGVDYTISSELRRLYLESEEPNICEHRPHSARIYVRGPTGPLHNQVQPQPQESLAPSQVLDNLSDLDELDDICSVLFEK